MSETLTIVTVVLNDVDNIEKTILSVKKIKSIYKINYIVIDGGSTDGTLLLINNLIDSIDLFVTEPDTGIYDAMNKSINFIKENNFILWLNSGDILVNCNFLNKNDLFNYDVILFSTMRLYTPGRSSRIFKSCYAGIGNKCYMKNRLHHQAFLIRRNLLENFPYKHLEYGLVADLYLMLKSCEFANINGRLLVSSEILTYYKPDGVSDLPNIDRIFSQIKMIKDLNMNPFIIFFCTPYRFLRMILKGIIPHSLGKLFT